MMSKPRVAVVAAASISLKFFMRPHLSKLSESFELLTICNASSEEMNLSVPVAGKFYSVQIERKISLLIDFMALLKLIKVFYKEKPMLVISITPKAGLLSMLAASICRVPVRSHIFTGQVWANRIGFSRLVLKCADLVTAKLATNALVDSESQKNFLVEEKIIAPDRIHTIANGSICGVDLSRFSPSITARVRIRREFRINDEAVVALFVGRLNIEKGIFDLAKAFLRVAEENSNLQLMIVGPDEAEIKQELNKILFKYSERVHFVGMSDKPEEYMAAADFLCLPSYREGFGSVVIEAAGVGLPALVSRIYGLTDAVSNEQTGIFHECGDIAGIADGLSRLCHDSDFRILLGYNASQRVHSMFAESTVVNWLCGFYENSLNVVNIKK